VLAALVMDRTGRAVPLSGDAGGPVELTATERAFVDAVRELPEDRQVFYLEGWLPMILRERDERRQRQAR
jgi:hypothetical protein